MRIANYQVSWKLVLDKDQFLMTDSWGDTVPVTEQEDLTFLSKATFWRVAHDLFHFATKLEGMDWKEVWQALTGEAVRVQSISVNRDDTTTVDFVELFNPGILRLHHILLRGGFRHLFKNWHLSSQHSRNASSEVYATLPRMLKRRMKAGQVHVMPKSK